LNHIVLTIVYTSIYTYYQIKRLFETFLYFLGGHTITHKIVFSQW